MDEGVLRFGDLVGKTEMLELACRRCERTGRYLVSRLIEERGARQGIPEWLYEIRVACPKHSTVSIYERCDAHCPQLSGMFPPAPKAPTKAEGWFPRR